MLRVYYPYQKLFWNVFSLRWCPLHHLLMCWCPTRFVLPLIYIIASPGHKYTLSGIILALASSCLLTLMSISHAVWVHPLLWIRRHHSLLTAAQYMAPHLFCCSSSETLKSFTFCWILLLLLRSHANCHVPLMFRTVSLGFVSLPSKATTFYISSG